MRGLLTAKLKEINDLSFFPEPHMIEVAMDNPVAFGKVTLCPDRHSHRRGESASCDQSAGVEAELSAALDSEDPWQRYWACIVASTQRRRGCST